MSWFQKNKSKSTLITTALLTAGIAAYGTITGNYRKIVSPAQENVIKIPAQHLTTTKTQTLEEHIQIGDGGWTITKRSLKNLPRTPGTKYTIDGMDVSTINDQSLAGIVKTIPTNSNNEAVIYERDIGYGIKYDPRLTVTIGTLTVTQDIDIPLMELRTVTPEKRAPAIGTPLYARLAAFTSALATISLAFTRKRQTTAPQTTVQQEVSSPAQGSYRSFRTVQNLTIEHLADALGKTDDELNPQYNWEQLTYALDNLAAQGLITYQEGTVNTQGVLDHFKESPYKKGLRQSKIILQNDDGSYQTRYAISKDTRPLPRDHWGLYRPLFY